MLMLGGAARSTMGIVARGGSIVAPTAKSTHVVARSSNVSPSSSASFDQPFRSTEPASSLTGSNLLSKLNIRQQNNSLFLLGVKRLCGNPQINNKKLPVGLLLTTPPRRSFSNYSGSSLREPLPGFDHSAGSFVDQYKRPEPRITVLDNGVRLVTQDNYGLTSTVGVWLALGSREETEEEYGLTHILERMSFKATSKKTAAEVVATHDYLGCSFTATTSRETMAYYVDGLRNYLPEIVETIQDTITDSLYKPEEVLDLKPVVEFEWMNTMENPDALISEVLHEVAFGEKSPLGHSLLCKPEKLEYFVANDSLRKFVRKHFVGARIVVSAVGVDHEEFVKIAKPFFEKIPKATEPIVRPPSPYLGGMALINAPATGQETSNVILAFKAPGVKDKDFVATCLLNILLGGGSSFSSGGPGKGMYSRLYQRVLNRFGWVQHSSAFVIPFDEICLFGAHCKADKGDQRSMIQVLVKELCVLTNEASSPESIGAEELLRAKNRLKGSVCQGLEIRQQLFEDLGRQLLTYGEYQTIETLCASIDAITPADLRRVMKSILTNSPPTLVSFSSDHDNEHTPSPEAIIELINGALQQ